MTRADGLGLGFGALLLALVWLFGPSPGALSAGLLLLCLIVADGIARPQSPWLLPIITHGPRHRPRVALTFDDGPDPRVTPLILDALAVSGAKATFFCIGAHVEAHPALARRIVAEGHELANHSAAHPRTLNLYGPRRMAAEIQRGAQIVEALGGDGRRYRPPMGLKSPPLARVAQALGLKVTLWSLHAHDTGSASAALIATRVLARIKPGDIVLLHDGGDRGASRAETAQATSLLLRELARVGLEPVTLGVLLEGEGEISGR